MELSVKVECPQMPNFIRAGAVTVAVAHLTNAQIEELIALWGNTFRAHVRTKQQQRVMTDRLNKAVKP